MKNFTRITNHPYKNTVIPKIITIGFLILILLIPSYLVLGLINEREGRKNAVVHEIADKWGNSQTLCGPILSIPYKSFKYVGENKVATGIHYMHFLPEELAISGNVEAETRYRGLYEAILYNANLNISSSFSFPDFTDFGITTDQLLLNDAFITLGISDMRGIKKDVSFTWEKQIYKPEPGLKAPDLARVIPSGIQAKIQLNNAQRKQKSLSFKTKLNLNGSEKLDFIPLGKKTSIELKANWPAPSFSGMFIPKERVITDDGFTAKWQVFHFNRNFPQKWLKNHYSLIESAFGVNFVLPVNGYQKTERTNKYAILFITLTFLTFFIIEIITHKRLHPVQYLLIGFALCLFDLLLLSLTEQFGFGIAYWCASSAIVLLITTYCKAVIRSATLAILVGALLGLLYSFLYIILQLQDYSLLVGSLGLFIILGIVMFITRRIDWYTLWYQTRDTGRTAYQLNEFD